MQSFRLTIPLLTAIAGCAVDAPPRPGHNFRVDIVASELEVPWSLALARDGRLFVAERSGKIRVIMHDTLQQQPWGSVPAFDGTDQNAEAGLMGLTLHPDFPATPYVYACYTQRIEFVGLVNRVARLSERGGRGEDLSILLDGIPAGQFHNGCRLKIGPDRKLYVTTGDAYLKAPAQDLESLAGKVLRLELDGTVPVDNPFTGSPVWSRGHRNPQGIAWDPASGNALLTEHGDGVIDEINILTPGANYGWPTVRGTARDVHFVDPALVLHVAPTGAAIIAHSGVGEKSEMLMTTLSGRLMRLEVDGSHVSIIDDALVTGYGRLRDVVARSDGSVYVSTSNRDGRGKRRRNDDRVLRVWLKGDTTK